MSWPFSQCNKNPECCLWRPAWLYYVWCHNNNNPEPNKVCTKALRLVNVVSSIMVWIPAIRWFCWPYKITFTIPWSFCASTLWAITQLLLGGFTPIVFSQTLNCLTKGFRIMVLVYSIMFECKAINVSANLNKMALTFLYKHILNHSTVIVLSLHCHC